MASFQQLHDIYAPDGRSNIPLAVRAGDLVYGTAIEPFTRASSDSTDDIHKQAREVLDRLQAALEQAGGSPDNVGRATVFVRSAGDQREAVYDVWDQLFPDANDKPAFKVLDAALPDGILLRLDFIALLDQRRTRFDIPNVDARDPTVRIGNLVFTSRLHGTSPATGETVEGLTAQAEQAVENGIRLVELAGGSRANVTQIAGFGRDLGYMDELRAALARQFDANTPPLHTLTTFVRPHLEVMVEFTACL